MGAKQRFNAALRKIVDTRIRDDRSPADECKYRCPVCGMAYPVGGIAPFSTAAEARKCCKALKASTSNQPPRICGTIAKTVEGGGR